ncbi:MAG: hypothetical protein NVS4B7_02940 [Ktedonobacteraceae bacterium]
MPATWSELEHTDSENGDDSFLWKVDPLLERQLPTKARVSQHKGQDISASGSTVTKTATGTLPTSQQHSATKRLRLAFIALAGIVLLAVIFDTILISLGSTRQDANKTTPSPILSVIPNTAHQGQTVLLHLSSFAKTTHVFLTHDIQEMVKTDASSPLIALDATGSADVHVLIENTWSIGPHTIEAEDVTTHYTTSATLQVSGNGSIARTHLVTDQNTLDMGADLQGANTIKPFELRNTGGGSVSWTIYSDQPWLRVTPTQGVFSASQQIFVAVTRTNLQPATSYRGTLTIVSNAYTAIPVYVQMAVLPLPANAGAVIEVTPPALAFTATDGGLDPTAQVLTISNPGKQPLSWSNAGATPINSSLQDVPWQSNINWLNTEPTSGIVAPGSTAQLQVVAHSQNLLQGVYSDMMVFTATNALNSPQHIAVSLTVQPRLSSAPTPVVQPTSSASPGAGETATVATTATVTGVATTPPPGSPIMDIMGSNPTFMYTQGQSNPASQSVNIANTGGSAFSWQATLPSVSWLHVTPISGSVPVTQSSQIVVSVQATQLVPGNYSAQISVSATDSSGVQLQSSPQLVSVKLTIFAPCSLQMTPSSLFYSASLLNPNPPAQPLSIKETGNCARPVLWTATVDQSWLSLSSTSGSNNSSITVYASAQGIVLVGKYTAHIRLSAMDSSRASIQNSPQIVSVTLNVSAT